MSSSTKLERLLNLTAALLETERPLTTHEIQRKVAGYPANFESFRRAFERDKEDLREMRLPLEIADVPGTDPIETGYRIPRAAYYLTDPGLEPDELAAVTLAASSIRLAGTEGTSALWKLGGTTADVDATPLADLPGSELLGTLFQAITERAPIRFRYRDEERSLDPHRLAFARGRWYLSGLDHDRGEERRFRIDRMDGTVTVGEPGTVVRPDGAHDGSQLEPWRIGTAEPITARVRVDAVQAPLAVSEVGAAAVVHEGEDGHVVLSMEVRNRAGFRGFVFGFLEHAEVLDPPELRDELVAWLEAAAVAAGAS